MNAKLLTIILCIILLICIFYKLYKKDNIQIEHFSNVLEKLKKQSNLKKNKNNNNSSKKTSFDDLIAATENMDPDKYTISNMKLEFNKYVDSFNKEKFKNNSKSTAEAFEKFAFYKEKFFEIFN